MLEITEHNLDEILANHSFLLIEFSAQWCGPCKSFAKVLEKAEQTFPDVVFGTIDIDDQQALAQEFNIMSVPSILIVRERTVVCAESGALDYVSLAELLEKARALKLEDLG